MPLGAGIAEFALYSIGTGLGNYINAFSTCNDSSEPPPTGPGGSGGANGGAAGSSTDPNSMIGPAAHALQLRNRRGNYSALPDRLRESPSATVLAQAVTITDQLDPNLNWSTVPAHQHPVWGDTILTIPPDQYYQATVPMTYGGVTFDVLVTAGIHTATGQVYATFQSINPLTELPPDVLDGFLPPENAPKRGMAISALPSNPRRVSPRARRCATWP